MPNEEILPSLAKAFAVRQEKRLHRNWYQNLSPNVRGAISLVPYLTLVGIGIWGSCRLVNLAENPPISHYDIHPEHYENE
jgi:hypothetical protein